MKLFHTTLRAVLLVTLTSMVANTYAFSVSPRQRASRSGLFLKESNPTPRVNPIPSSSASLFATFDEDIRDDLKELGSSVTSIAIKLGKKFVGAVSDGVARLKGLAENFKTDETSFDQEDEQLFRDIFEQQQDELENKIVVHPEVMEGIRVVGIPGPVLDAEILAKTFDSKL